MSLYRQLWLAIVLSMLLALCGALAASLLSARNYLEAQLSIKNTDNATVLAQSLSQGTPDAVLVELLVSSLYDSGHYELIRITDPQGKPIAERADVSVAVDAPAWFAKSLPIHAEPGVAQITSGWKQFGEVTLVSHSRYAYGALWKSAYEMVLSLIGAGLLGGYLGSLILGRMRRPLAVVIGQARDIVERRFVTVELPHVPELHQLANAMNATVVRLKAMFEEEAARLEAVRLEANTDPITGLYNRANFIASIDGVLISEHATGGTLFIVRLGKLADVNHTLGHRATDDLIKSLAQAISTTAKGHPESLSGRLNGSDFGLFLPGASVAPEVAQELHQSLHALVVSAVLQNASIWLAGGYFPAGLTKEKVFSQVDGVLATLETQGASGFSLVQLSSDDRVPKANQDWVALIMGALQNHRVRLVSFPVVSMDGQLIHQECPIRLMFEEGGEWQAAGRFWPVAERLRLTAELDMAALRLGLKALDLNKNLVGLAINLSAKSLAQSAFLHELIGLLKQTPAASRLWLEVSEANAFDHFESFTVMCNLLRGVGCKIGIEHFGRRFSEIGLLHGLGLDYIKVDASFVKGLGTNPGNQTFLKGVASIAHSIGLQVIAEGVSHADDLHALHDVGFDGATGPAVSVVEAGNT